MSLWTVEGDFADPEMDAGWVVVGDQRLRAVDGRAPGSGAAWFVYVLQSTTLNRTYVGIARDPLARQSQHNGVTAGGARSTRSGRPWELRRVFGPYDSRSTASQAEYRLKKRRGAARWQGDAP